MLKFFVLLVIYLKLSFQTDIISNLCTEDFCQHQEFKLNEEQFKPCEIQNSTFNGLVFPSHTECNCGKICIRNLDLDEDCSIGQPGSPFPTSMCGSQLYCTQRDHVQPTCQKMPVTTECLKAQKEFDGKFLEGKIGHLEQRPECDENGNFNRIKCIPGQNCFCINEDGARIFGDGVSNRNIELNMKCECSRLNNKLKKTIGSAVSLRCSSNGNYDPIQCFDGLCLCIEPHKGFPVSDTRNLTLGLAALPCYNNNLHMNTSIERECEVLRNGLVPNNESTINDVRYEMCDPDGYFSPVQEQELKLVCVDKDGTQIDSYEVEKESGSEKKINCKCARARKLLIDSGYFELPQCQPNGNYEKIQCRRGQCYCVDEDGLQNSLRVSESNIESLNC